MKTIRKTVQGEWLVSLYAECPTCDTYVERTEDIRDGQAIHHTVTCQNCNYKFHLVVKKLEV